MHRSKTYLAGLASRLVHQTSIPVIEAPMMLSKHLNANPFSAIYASVASAAGISVLNFHQRNYRTLVACEGQASVHSIGSESDNSYQTEGERDRREYSAWVVAMCWSVYIFVWMAAVIGPAFVVVCAVKGWWDYLLTFLIAWLAGGIIDFPYMSSFTDLVSSGIESWFKKFSIEFEPKYHERTDKHDSDRPTIYCYHPHGLFSIGAGLFAVNLVRRGEKVALVTSTHMRWFNPLLKLLLDLAGIILVGSSPQEVQAVMKEGTHSLILVVGGYEEAVMTQDGFERMYIKNRLGFVKYAMRYNYTLTPVYAFGENDLYKCISFAGEFRKWLVRYKIPIVLFYGDASMPLLPRRTNDGLRIVVGDPVPVIVSSQPKINELRECHEWYLEALMSLYYRRKQSDRLLEVF